jgi:lysophospholipase L1-like esterase
VGALVALAACGADAATERAPAVAPAQTGQSGELPQLTSVVQLGDSIASGEGTLYGYTWDPTTQEWTGGNVDAPWPPPYPDCHVSPAAYGNAVAEFFGATLHQFACSGATFANGISAPESSGDTVYRPAEFGNWDDQSDLNPDYDTAGPQLVLITLGADDLQFSAIVEDCIKNGYWHYFHIEDLRCVQTNPGDTIETDFFDFLPTLKENYGTLVKWIKERAKANNVPAPKIVFTNYANPLPEDGAICNDTNYLYKEQLEYLYTLVEQANETIEDAITALDDPDVVLADISGAYVVQGVSHIWCSDTPWAYGLSIYSMTSPSSFRSNAPFHPTPDGQQSIAEHVVPAIQHWFKPAA